MLKHYLILLAFGLLSVMSVAQTDSTSKSYVAPEFKDGRKGFNEYLWKYLRYPRELCDNGKQGQVVATIYVDKSGNINDVIATGKNDVFNKEVKRVLILMPPWESGKLNGVSIDTTVIREIYFSLEDSRIKKDSTKYECLMYSVKLSGQEAISKINERAAEANYSLGKNMYNRGVNELENKNPADALDFFNQAEQQGFHNIDLYFNRAAANFRTGNKEAACQDWLEGARRGDTEALDLYNKKCK